MSFWLYDPTSFKRAALFPTGGIGNFLNTVTLVLISAIVLLKTKFQDMIDDKTLYMYSGSLFVLITTLGILFGGNDADVDGSRYNFDLTYD